MTLTKECLDINSMLRHQISNVATSCGECLDMTSMSHHRFTNVTTLAEVGRTKITNAETLPQH